MTIPEPGPTADATTTGRARFVAEFHERALRLPALTRGRVQTIGTLNLVVGLLLLVLVGALVIVVTATVLAGREPVAPAWQMWFGGVFLTVVGGLMVWNAVRVRRMLRNAGPGARTPLPRPAFAFAVEGDRLELPEGPGAPAESWPLSETTATPARRFGIDLLRLASPGRRPRVFQQRFLARPVAELAAAVDAARASGR